MAKQKIDTIGTIEVISLPELNLFDIPAKIDTGADSSSIWASDIQLSSQGELSFALFGPGSKFYTGKRIIAEEYRSTSVKNSFGIAEFRYKVQLLLQIGDRTIRAWVTLSDRSTMKYPILLGRRLLKNKFLVDVSKAHIHKSADRPRRVLVLGSTDVNTQSFFNDVARYSAELIEYVVRGYRQLAFWIETGKVSVTELVTNTDIADYDMVYFKVHRDHYEFAMAAAEYLRYHHVPVMDTELLNHVTYDKLGEYMRLALYGTPVPTTFCAYTNYLGKNINKAVEKIGAPFVCKEINADRGRKNFLLSSSSELAEILADTESSDIFLLQKYIPNDGYMRALVFGINIALAVKRSSVDNKDPRKNHLNNPAGAVNAHLLTVTDIPSEVHNLAIRAAKTMDRQVAGVDVIRDGQSGEWFVLEVNTAPQIRSGSFIEEKKQAFAAFMDAELNK
jgi:glutathione synthase/RimK-type ligase-like ATP-grasp enzyme